MATLATPRIFVFAYGSLLNRRDAERSLRRELPPAPLLAVAHGFTRVWRAPERVLFERAASAQIAAFLDLKRAPGQWVNGVLIEVTTQELERLRFRELGYDCVDITGVVETSAGKPPGIVFAFFSKQPLGDQDALVVPAHYVDLVKEGVQALPLAFQAQFWATTAPLPAACAPGDYVFTHPLQASAA